MQFKVSYSKRRGRYWSAACVRSFRDGSRCGQKGKILDEGFYHALYERIVKIDSNLLYTMQHHQQQRQEVNALLQLKNKELEKHRKALEVIQDGYEEGIIDKMIYVARRGQREQQIRQSEEEIGRLQVVLEQTSQMPTQEQLLNQVDKFKRNWSESESAAEKNRALRALVEKITYNREGNKVVLKVLYR